MMSLRISERNEFVLPHRRLRVERVFSREERCSVCGEGSEGGYRLNPEHPDLPSVAAVTLCSHCAGTFVLDVFRTGDPQLEAMPSRKEWEQGIVPRDVPGYKSRIAQLDQQIRAVLNRRLTSAGSRSAADFDEIERLRAERASLIDELAR